MLETQCGSIPVIRLWVLFSCTFKHYFDDNAIYNTKIFPLFYLHSNCTLTVISSQFVHTFLNLIT